MQLFHGRPEICDCVTFRKTIIYFKFNRDLISVLLYTIQQGVRIIGAFGKSRVLCNKIKLGLL